MSSLALPVGAHMGTNAAMVLYLVVDLAVINKELFSLTQMPHLSSFHLQTLAFYYASLYCAY